MSLTSYRAAPPRGVGIQRTEYGEQIRRTPGQNSVCEEEAVSKPMAMLNAGGVRLRYSVFRILISAFCGPGGDLLSRVLRQSTIGAEAFDGRVRDGIGSYRLAEGHQAGEEQFRRRRTEHGEQSAKVF